MMHFYMTIGLPGAGKTAWADGLEDVDVHSSDDIRAELFGNESDQGNNTLVFEILHKRVKESLLAGRSCVYDATNLKHRRRKDFLREIRRLNVQDLTCECVFFATPYDVCLERNKSRDRVVPEDVIKKMRQKFDPPTLREGWDLILVVDCPQPARSAQEKIRELSALEHDNPHHDLTVGQHSIAAFEYYNTKYAGTGIGTAVLLHDIGKESTKVFRDSNGNKTDIAHYYRHENVGAYDSFLYTKGLSTYDRIRVATLIRWHMYPFAIEQSQNPKKTKNKLLYIVGDELFKEIMILHECDKAAH